MNTAPKRRAALSKRDRWLAALFCVATVVLFLFVRTPDSDKIDTREIAELMPLTHLAQLSESSWEEAATQYRSGLYSVAGTHYQALSKSGPDPRRARLFWGSCQLQSQRIDAAELTLRPLLTVGTPDSVEAAARWLLAQVYLTRNEDEPAADELRRLAKDVTYGAQAQEKSKILEAMLLGQ